jgi:hypothetical protein
MDLEDFRDLCAEAELFIIRGMPIWEWRREYDLPRRRVFIDVDPGFTQVGLVRGDASLMSTMSRCERLFTIGQRIGAPDCPIPTADREWLKTVPPVALEEWSPVPTTEATRFTSVLNLQGFHETSYDGLVLAQKDKEFPAFLSLPRLTAQRFLLALIGNPDALARHGWETVPGEAVTRTPGAYRAFIQNSRAEFSVSKQGYASTRGGWFSDRSVCYLASGRPVLVRDTGLKDWLPTGDGLLTFSNVSEAVRGVEAINGDYEHHRRVAREVAERHFASGTVLPALLSDALL